MRLEALLNCWRIPELRRRLLFTAGMLAIFRLCAHITVPGVDAGALAQLMASADNTLFAMVDMFSGGAFLNMSLAALGVMPYISASIIMQLLTTVVPFLEKLSKEGEAGRRQITKYTRYGTVLLAGIQGSALSMWMRSMQLGDGSYVVPQDIPAGMFHFVTVLTLVTGTIFLMWLGEQITERGIGNGISLLIFVGIVDRLPAALLDTWREVASQQLDLLTALFIGVLTVLVTAAVVIVQQGQRRIPVTYAKQVRGNKVYGGQSTHLPLKVDYAGVIAVIFASSLLMFPATIVRFFAGNNPSLAWLVELADQFQHDGWIYNVTFFVLIVFFCYFYTAVTFNPTDVAENLRKHGGFVPGRRPGKPTADYIEYVMTRITLVGAVFVALISLLPTLLINRLGAPFYFGGTALLIVVGVALDTLSQMESHLVLRHYESFMKSGRLRGRRG